VRTGQIHLLDDALVNQIAAGEVVGRPANVVKELIENALDAEASRIEIDIAHGGLASIRVCDNGTGMAQEDAVLCTKAHATSKLRHIDDLHALGTFGFRGEALASIAAVSKLSLQTRPQDASAGTALEVQGAHIAPATQVGCAPGTTLEVRDLFFNVPARLKFLKSIPTETAHIAEVCLNAALGNHQTLFVLRKDTKPWRQYVPATDRLEHAMAVLRDGSLRACQDEVQGIRVDAALSPPERARASMLGLRLFLNQRPVKDRALAHAICHAYGSVLPPGRYPTGVLFLELPMADIDVNVHPQKTEVRIAHQREVLQTVSRLLARHLGRAAWNIPRHFSAPPRPVPETDLGAATPYTEVPTHDDGQALASPTGVYSPIFGPVQSQVGFFSSLKFLAQVRKMLIVCEGEDALYILDQHAIDERVRFFQLHESYHRRSIQTQRLLFPERLECSAEDADCAQRYSDELLQLGLECAVLGEQTLVVHTIPALAQRASPRRLMRDALDELSRQGQRSFGDTIDTLLATMACHAAIRAGDHLSAEECRVLLASLDTVGSFNLHCPHGRPIVDKIPFADIERRLGR
jgi:DNA mismatch repair protein MutL